MGYHSYSGYTVLRSAMQINTTSESFGYRRNEMCSLVDFTGVDAKRKHILLYKFSWQQGCTISKNDNLLPHCGSLLAHLPYLQACGNLHPSWLI